MSKKIVFCILELIFQIISESGVLGCTRHPRRKKPGLPTRFCRVLRYQPYFLLIVILTNEDGIVQLYPIGFVLLVFLGIIEQQIETKAVLDIFQVVDFRYWEEYPAGHRNASESTGDSEKFFIIVWQCYAESFFRLADLLFCGALIAEPAGLADILF